MENRTYVVALTGGIASGKTALSDRFHRLGVPVIDTDLIAHELVEPGQPVLREIVDTFGHEVLLEDGHLDRRSLRKRVFSSQQDRIALERILHPAIRAEALKRISKLQEPYCLLVIPLLVEGGDFPGIDHVLLVDVPEEVQRDRVMRRDGVSRQQAEAALASQASRQQRLAIADDVVENSGAIDSLDAVVDTLHEKFLQAAAGLQ